MQLNDVLSSKVNVSLASTDAVLYVHGLIEPDHDANYFRLYRDNHNRLSYLLIKKSDVVGELHEWSSAETAHAGFIGSTIHRIPVMHGTQIQKITVTIHRLGRDISGELNSQGETGVCRYTAGCNSNCCTTTNDGECRCNLCCVA